MPSDVGTSKNSALKYLKDMLWSKVKGWMETLLPAGGKEVLIKLNIFFTEVFVFWVLLDATNSCNFLTFEKVNENHGLLL